MKRKIRFQLEGETYEVQVEADGDQLTIEREGEQFTVTLLPEARARPRRGRRSGGGTRRGAPRGRQGSAPKPSMKSAPSQAAGVLYSPMTGLVKEIKVAVGADVKKGDVVLIMEAMKMDVEVSAPASGVVAEIAVRAGDTVESQAPLLIIQ